MSAAWRRFRSRWLVWALSTLVLAGCGEKTSTLPQVSGDPGPIHVHGLGINPADGALFVATHTGLFRAAPGEVRSRRVANRYQDTMGFTVVDANRFLGSGHPDLRERRPPFLGLIESSDAGRTWRAISLEGKADFHVLEASGPRVYGYGTDFKSRDERFMTSTDGGRSWKRLAAPEALISLAISPSDPRRVVASGDLQFPRRWALMVSPRRARHRPIGLDARRPVPGRSPRARKPPSRRVRGLAVNRGCQRTAGRV